MSDEKMLERIAELQYEAGMYQSLYEAAIKRDAPAGAEAQEEMRNRIELAIRYSTFVDGDKVGGITDTVNDIMAYLRRDAAP